MSAWRWWRMRFGRKQNPNDGRLGEVARLAQSPGTDKGDLVRSAVQALLAGSDVDRAGVWIDEGDIDARSPRGLAMFRGVVSDRDGDGTPAEWCRLSLEGLPSLEPLTGGHSVEHILDGTRDQLMLGALLELHHVVWTPVEARGRLRGVLLAGTRRKHGALSLARIETVSAELALAIELEEERRLARQRQADLNATSRFLAELVASGPVDSIFTRLIDGCTETAPGGDGLGAVFAMLRTGGDSDAHFDRSSHHVILPAVNRASLAPEHDARRRDAPAWRSGDAAWLQAMDSSPLANIWRRASDTRETLVITSGSGLPWPRADVARVVAIPLLVSRESVGTLVAGFRPGPATHGAVERLELRGELAAAALAQRQCVATLLLERKKQRAILESDAAAKIVVESSGRLGALSRGALELLGQDPLGQDARNKDANGVNLAEPSDALRQPRFSELFQAPDQPKIEAWLQRVQAQPRHDRSLDDDAQEARLRSGAAVRLHPIPLNGTSGAALAAVTLEALEKVPSSPQPHRSETQLHHVIEWLEEGVVLFNAQHEIQAMNSRFAQIVGFAPEAASRVTTLSSLISRMADQAAEPEKFSNRWRELARGADSGVRDEIQLLRPVPRVLERASRPILSADGERLGRVEIYRDLTAQRVFQSKLLQTEKLAALGQMVTGVAHELSNPLTSILGYAQRLFLRTDADGQSDEARQIFQEAERAGTILRQLLMTARDSRPDRRAISLNQVVTRTMELQKFNLGRRGNRDRTQSRFLFARRAGRCRPIAASLNEFDRQLAPGDRATRQRRQNPHRDASRRRPSSTRNQRRWARHPCRDRVPHLRSVFHHEAGRHRHRPRPCDRPRYRARTRWPSESHQPAGPRGEFRFGISCCRCSAPSHPPAHQSSHHAPSTQTPSQQASQPASIAVPAIGSGLPHRDAVASRRASARPSLPAVPRTRRWLPGPARACLSSKTSPPSRASSVTCSKTKACASKLCSTGAKLSNAPPNKTTTSSSAT